jgi:hypothetical protein
MTDFNVEVGRSRHECAFAGASDAQNGDDDVGCSV